MLLWCHAGVDVEGVMPNLLHVVPIGQDTAIDWVLEGQHTTLALSLITNVAVLLVHTNHDTRHLWSSNDGWENCARSIVTCESRFAPCSQAEPYAAPSDLHHAAREPRWIDSWIREHVAGSLCSNLHGTRDCWVRRLRCDATHVARGADLQVTTVTPAGSARSSSPGSSLQCCRSRLQEHHGPGWFHNQR